MEATLIMFRPNGERREFPLKKKTTVVGRRPNCDLRIPLSSVSRQHCEINLQDNSLHFRDLGSSNGTFYNGKRELEGQLNAGDHLSIGPVIFTIVIDGQPADIQSIKTILPNETAEVNSTPLTSDAPDRPEVLDDSTELPLTIEDEMHSPTTQIDDDDIPSLDDLVNPGD